jgi:arginyl-tRNA synthetase
MQLSPEEIARLSREAREYLGEIPKKEPRQKELWEEIESEIILKYQEQLKELGINLLDSELTEAITDAICLEDSIIRTLQRAKYGFENETHAHNYFTAAVKEGWKPIW